MIPAIFGLSGLALTADERAFFRASDPAGYILFARNAASRGQLRALTDDLRALAGRDDLLIAIDQEGGRVARLKPPEWEPFPPAARFAQLYAIAPVSAIEAARANAQALGIDLAQVGISMNTLPLLDMPQPDAHDVIGDRALGAEGMQVAALGRAVLEGLARGGVAGCIKHIPGHGRAQADSHKALPVVAASEAELEQDLAPFRQLADAPIAMTAHIRYTAWDTRLPATLSPFVIGRIVRERIGFGGLLLTDDIDMAALSGSIPERAVQALAAGCDLVLNCWARMDDMEALAAGLPAIGEVSRARLKRAIGPLREARLDERADLIAQRDRLLALIPQRAGSPAQAGPAGAAPTGLAGAQAGA